MSYISISVIDRIQAIQKLNNILEYSREQNKQKNNNKESFKEILHKVKNK